MLSIVGLDSWTRRLVIHGLIALSLVNNVRLSTTNGDVRLTSDVEAEADHVRSLGRIVNGTRATANQFPHQVSLRRTLTMSHFCGGNIIDSEWILTAAHCMFYTSGVQRQPWEITVVGGDLWLNVTSSTNQQRFVREIIIHENYNKQTLHNDIAVMRLWSNLTLTDDAVRYQVLQTRTVTAGTNCQVAGWGAPVFESNVVTNELMYVNVPIVSQVLCRQLYANISRIPNGMICAGYTEGLKDACQGDSGGGLICDGQLTGIVSFGEGCAWPNYPGVYAEVKYYRNWVLEKTAIEDRANGVGEIQFSLALKFVSLAIIGLAIAP